MIHRQLSCSISGWPARSTLKNPQLPIQKHCDFQRDFGVPQGVAGKMSSQVKSRRYHGAPNLFLALLWFFWLFLPPFGTTPREP